MRTAIGDVGIAHDHRGKGVILQPTKHVHAIGPAEIIEPVAVLKRLHLLLEGEAEAGAKHPAEGHDGLSQTADPVLDRVDAGFDCGPSARAVDEVKTVRRSGVPAQNQIGGRGALLHHGRGVRDCVVGAVGRNEVDDGCRVLKVRGIVRPAFIRLEELAAGGCIELLASGVERGHACIPTPRDVQRGQVERQANEVVAQGAGDKLVNIGTGLAGHATGHGTRRLIRGQCLVKVEGDRVEERFDQAGRGVHAVLVHRLNVLGQHRVAEAINYMGELRHDGGIDLGAGIYHKGRDLRLHGAAELFEGEVLILHLGGEFCRLEQTPAIPREGVDRGCRKLVLVDRGGQPFVDEGQLATVEDGLLHFGGLAVVFAVEHVVHRGQAEVFVATAISCDEMTIQQFVVVGFVLAELVGDDRVAGVGVGIGLLGGGFAGEAIDHIGAGHGVMGDVFEEGMAVADRLAGIDGVGQIAFDQDIQRLGAAFNIGRVSHDQLWQAVGTRDEVAVGVGCEQRAIKHVAVIELDSQLGRGLRLDVAPGGHAAGLTVQQVTVGDRASVGVEIVFAQEDLMGGVRGVGLVLVDPGCRLVEMLSHVVCGPKDSIRAGLVGGAGQHHEVGRRCCVIERIVRLERNVDGAAATFSDKVETMIEELTEECHPRVVGRREAFVGGHVGQHHVVAVHGDRMRAQQRVERGLSLCSDRLSGRQRGVCSTGCVQRIKVGCSGIESGLFCGLDTLRRAELGCGLFCRCGRAVQRNGRIGDHVKLCKDCGIGSLCGDKGLLCRCYTALRCVEISGFRLHDTFEAGHFVVGIGKVDVECSKLSFDGSQLAYKPIDDDLSRIHIGLRLRDRFLRVDIGLIVLLRGQQILLHGGQIALSCGQDGVGRTQLGVQTVTRGDRGIALAGQGGDLRLGCGQGRVLGRSKLIGCIIRTDRVGQRRFGGQFFFARRRIGGGSDGEIGKRSTA